MWYIKKIENNQLQDVVSVIQDAYLLQLNRLKITKELWPDYIAFKTKESLEEDIRKEDLYVLYEEKEPIGTVCVDHSLSVFKKGYVKWLAVVQHAQEKGYGTHLMNFAEKLLFEKGASCVEVSVLNDDLGMEKFALHRGYEITHRVSARQLPFDMTYFQLNRKRFKERHGSYCS